MGCRGARERRPPADADLAPAPPPPTPAPAPRPYPRPQHHARTCTRQLDVDDMAVLKALGADVMHDVSTLAQARELRGRHHVAQAEHARRAPRLNFPAYHTAAGWRCHVVSFGLRTFSL
jgi:hypothetical protein